MPDNDRNLIASSEFDPAPYTKGIDTMIASVTQLVEQEAVLQKKLADSTTALNANNAALKANQQAIATLDKTSAGYQKQLDDLTQQQAALNQEHTVLTEQAKAAQTELGKTAGSVGQYKTALDNLRKTALAVRQQGGNLFDAASLNKQLTQITQVAGTFRNVFQGKIDTSELDALEDKLAATGDEFERLRQVIDFIKPKLAELDPNSQEFADLNAVVEQGTEVLDAYGKVQDNVTDRAPSLRAELAGLKNQMAQMIADGVDPASEGFQELQHRAAEVQDAIDKTGERVRTFANDTRLLEGGIEALRGIAAGFELAEGASALFGVKNEAVEESIKRLNAIMAIANGLQEISNLLKKESVVRLITEEIATKAMTISQRILAATLGTTAAASRALNVALAATGIGALVVGIGVLISVLSSWTSATKEQTEAQENLNVALEQGNKDNELFIAGILEAGRVLSSEAEVRQAQADRAGETELNALRRRQANQRELRQIDLRNLQEAVDQARRYEESRVAAGEEADQKLRQITNHQIEANEEYITSLQKTVQEANKATDTRIELENQLELKTLQAARDGARARLEVDNLLFKQREDFIKRLTELQARLTDAQNKVARQDAAQIEKQSADKLRVELAQIDTDVRKGTLTAARGKVLKDLLKQINAVEVTQELKEFEKKSIAAQQSIEDQIFQLRATSGENRANLLRDALEKEAALIEVTSRREAEQLERQRTELLEGVQNAFQLGLISPGQAEANADRIKLIYARLFEDLRAQTARKQEELANLAFQRSQELVQQLFAPTFVGISEAATKEIQGITAKYAANKISYEQYQIELTNIARRESKHRIDVQLTEANELLAGVRRRLALEQDPERRKALEARILELRQQISDLQRQMADAEAGDEKAREDAIDRRVQKVATYVQAIGGLVDAVVGFWARANQAEQEQLDRSISIQEKRVEAATRIAERGNAQYLKLEEDRLNELRIKQENAARRQLAINAVLQASQALVAFTSALAQGISTGGVLGGIAIATAVLGLLASGYAIVQSLQRQAPAQLAEGTEYLQGTGHPDGVDTVPAMLTKGEAVLPVDMNEAYHPTVAAMFAGDVPAEDMNAFVHAYRANTRTLPALAHDRLGEAAEAHTTRTDRLLAVAQQQSRQLQEQSEIMGDVARFLKHLNISMTMDKNGLAMGVQSLIARETKQKKV